MGARVDGVEEEGGKVAGVGPGKEEGERAWARVVSRV